MNTLKNLAKALIGASLLTVGLGGCGPSAKDFGESVKNLESICKGDMATTIKYGTFDKSVSVSCSKTGGISETFK